MTRGNQREKDRERAQARNGNKAKNSKDDGLTPEQRRQRDAKALQEKMAKKAAAAAGNDATAADGKTNKKAAAGGGNNVAAAAGKANNKK